MNSRDPRISRNLFKRIATAMCTIAALVILVSTTACSTKVTTSDGRRMPSKPINAPVTPANALTNAMALLVGLKPTDTDGNSFPDQISIQTFLYAQPYPTSIHEQGAFVFELYTSGTSTQNTKPLATWRFEADELDRAKVNSRLFAQGYRFNLSLLAHGSDVLPSMTTNLIGRFEPADGRSPIHSSGVRIIQIGRKTTSAVGKR